jgi:hypothetical protein
LKRSSAFESEKKQKIEAEETHTASILTIGAQTNK